MSILLLNYHSDSVSYIILISFCCRKLALSIIVTDGCKSNNTVIPSYQSGSPLLNLTIVWPEINIGETIILGCPCGSVDLQSSFLVASRTCGGDYLSGAKWEEPNVDPCNFTDSIRELCLLASVCFLLILYNYFLLFMNNDYYSPHAYLI